MKAKEMSKVTKQAGRISAILKDFASQNGEFV